MAQYGSEVLAIELANLLDHARPVPLLRDRVRVDKHDILTRVNRIATAVRIEVADHGLEEAVGSSLVVAADNLLDEARHAYPIPLTDQVRLPRARVAELATALRCAAQA